jgi:SAM-dependent methyltransferase
LDDLSLLIDFHVDALRQGPGGDEETRLAIALSGLAGRSGLKIADIGCGSGAPTRVLARELDATVTAVDLFPAFLRQLESWAEREGLSDRIEPLAASMEALPFDAEALDAIWSEGAIYNMGFEEGVRNWRRFLKPGGILAVSELTWLTEQRPTELERHWMEHYPQVDTASAKLRILESNGYRPLAYFVLKPHCWLENYYRPMQARFGGFLARHGHAPGATAIVSAEEAEIGLYESNTEFVSYGYYVAQKTGD